MVPNPVAGKHARMTHLSQKDDPSGDGGNSVGLQVERFIGSVSLRQLSCGCPTECWGSP